MLSSSLGFLLPSLFKLLILFKFVIYAETVNHLGFLFSANLDSARVVFQSTTMYQAMLDFAFVKRPYIIPDVMDVVVSDQNYSLQHA